MTVVDKRLTVRTMSLIATAVTLRSDSTRDPFYVGGSKYNSTMNERDKMDWDNVINWDAVDKLTDEQVSAILDMFDK